jgi:hypothetical protein
VQANAGVLLRHQDKGQRTHEATDQEDKDVRTGLNGMVFDLLIEGGLHRDPRWAVLGRCHRYPRGSAETSRGVRAGGRYAAARGIARAVAALEV